MNTIILMTALVMQPSPMAVEMSGTILYRVGAQRVMVHDGRWNPDYGGMFSNPGTHWMLEDNTWAPPASRKVDRLTVYQTDFVSPVYRVYSR